MIGYSLTTLALAFALGCIVLVAINFRTLLDLTKRGLDKGN